MTPRGTGPCHETKKYNNEKESYLYNDIPALRNSFIQFLRRYAEC